MEKKLMILVILTVIGIAGIVLFQTNVVRSAFLAGFGYVLSVLSILVAVIVAMINK